MVRRGAGVAMKAAWIERMQEHGRMALPIPFKAARRSAGDVKRPIRVGFHVIRRRDGSIRFLLVRPTVPASTPRPAIDHANDPMGVEVEGRHAGPVCEEEDAVGHRNGGRVKHRPRPLQHEPRWIRPIAIDLP
jgi:hypothetical protein